MGARPAGQECRENTALHYACRGAKYDIISLLLDKFDAVSVSKRNAYKKLPIDLLWESNAVKHGSVFRLLMAYPETVTIVGAEAQTVDAGASQSKSGNFLLEMNSSRTHNHRSKLTALTANSLHNQQTLFLRGIPISFTWLDSF